MSNLNINSCYFDLHEDDKVFVGVDVKARYVNIRMPDTKFDTIAYVPQREMVRRLYSILPKKGDEKIIYYYGMGGISEKCILSPLEHYFSEVDKHSFSGDDEGILCIYIEYVDVLRITIITDISTETYTGIMYIIDFPSIKQFL